MVEYLTKHKGKKKSECKLYDQVYYPGFVSETTVRPVLTSKLRRPHLECTCNSLLYTFPHSLNIFCVTEAE